MNLANRYIELILFYQTKVKRELDHDEIQVIKNIVAQELKEGNDSHREMLENVNLGRLPESSLIHI
jgi:hypothetical protein